MARLNAKLDRLRGMPRALRDAALAATLPHTSAPECDALVAEILALSEAPKSASLLLEVFHAWPQLTPAARAAVLAHLGPAIGTHISRLRASLDPTDRRAAIHLTIACLATPGLSGPASGAAEGADFSLAVSELGLTPELDAALASAAVDFPDHRLHGVLDVIARVAHMAGPALHAFLLDDTQPAHMPLRAAVKSLPAQLQRERATLWLSYPTLAPIARRVLQEPTSVDEQRAAMERAHYLLAPARQRALRGISAPVRLLVEGEDFAAQPIEARRGQVRWITRLPLKEPQRASALGGLLADAEPVVRFDAVMALAKQTPTRAVDEALADFTYDSDPRVAACALSELADAETPARRRHHAPLFERLQRSPHAPVRAIAASARNEVDLWSEFAHGDRWACPLAARVRLASQPLEFLIEFRQEYQRSASAHRARLLTLSDRLGVLDRMESELLEAAIWDSQTAGGALDTEEARDAERLASKAVLLLGRLNSPDARAVLDAALESAKSRIRANAFEGLAMARPELAAATHYLTDPLARLRANAARLLLRREPNNPAAHRNLAEMLADSRPGHRLSALWVAERSSVFSLVPRVADMTRADPDPAVHARARRSARRLLAAMRHGWSGGPDSDHPSEGGVVVTRPQPHGMAGAS